MAKGLLLLYLLLLYLLDNDTTGMLSLKKNRRMLIVRQGAHSGPSHKFLRLLCELEAKRYSNGGTRWRSWLMHCATSRKVAGSIPDGVIGIFH